MGRMRYFNLQYISLIINHKPCLCFAWVDSYDYESCMGDDVSLVWASQPRPLIGWIIPGVRTMTRQHPMRDSRLMRNIGDNETDRKMCLGCQVHRNINWDLSGCHEVWQVWQFCQNRNCLCCNHFHASLFLPSFRAWVFLLIKTFMLKYMFSGKFCFLTNGRILITDSYKLPSILLKLK